MLGSLHHYSWLFLIILDCSSIRPTVLAIWLKIAIYLLNCVQSYIVNYPWIFICERKRALDGIQCVLRIFWQTWLHKLMNKTISTLCKYVTCNTLTHSTNEDLLNIERKGDPEVLYPLSYVRYYWNPEPVCNKSHFGSLFYLYWYF